MAMRAIVADDHPMCREMAKLALAQVVPDIEIHEAATLAHMLETDTPVDIIVLDLSLPDSRGVASLIDVARHWPATPILVVSALDGPMLERRLSSNGAAGFVSKAAPVAELIIALQSVINGSPYFSIDPTDGGGAVDDASRLALLTAAESRVLRAMRGGRLNKQIAHDLGLSEITVKQHVKAILRKLEVANRTQAILLLHDAQPDDRDPF